MNFLVRWIRSLFRRRTPDFAVARLSLLRGGADGWCGVVHVSDPDCESIPVEVVFSGDGRSFDLWKYVQGDDRITGHLSMLIRKVEGVK